MIDFATRRGPLVAVAVISLLLAACSANPTSSAPAGNGNGAPPADCVEVDANGVIAISADNLEFSAPCMVANAGEAFTIVLTNMEGAPHNVTVYTDDSKSTEIGHTETITGPDAESEVEMEAMDAGEYYFDCTVHPNMNGTLYVVAA